MAEKPASIEHAENVPGEFITAEAKDAVHEAAAQGQGLTGYETLTLWETCKAFKISTLVCFMAAFSAVTDGYQIGMNGSIIANAGFVQQFGTVIDAEGNASLASPILSGWSSIMSVGQILGMTTLPFISDRYGRKVAMYWYWFLLAMSILCESVARTWPVWLVAKLLAGMGVGCLQSTIPVYITEVAPTRIRGGLLICYSLWFGLGFFFSAIALQQMNQNEPNVWLTPVLTQWGQILLMIIIYVFLPETPAWCVTKGKMDRARKSLLKLNRGVKNYSVEDQLRVLTMAVEHESEVAALQKNQRWYAIFKGTDGFRTLVACWTLMTQQFVGLTLFSTFGTFFYQQAGLEDPFTITCITTALNTVTVIILILIIDKVGRRWVSCGGTTLSWLSCLVIGILGVAPSSRATDYILVLFACLWNIGIQGNGTTGWGFIGEISSHRLRPYTAGFGAASTCVAGVVMNVLTPYMVNTRPSGWEWGLKTGFFYAGVGLPFVVGMWLLIPETKGLTAAELDELFTNKVSPRKFRKTETATQRAVKMVREEPH